MRNPDSGKSTTTEDIVIDVECRDDILAVLKGHSVHSRRHGFEGKNLRIAGDSPALSSRLTLNNDKLKLPLQNSLSCSIYLNDRQMSRHHV